MHAAQLCKTHLPETTTTGVYSSRPIPMSQQQQNKEETRGKYKRARIKADARDGATRQMFMNDFACGEYELPPQCAHLLRGGPSSCKPAPRSVARALLTPTVKHGPHYRCGKRTFLKREACRLLRQEERGLESCP